MTSIAQTASFTILALQFLAATHAQGVFESYQTSLYNTSVFMRPGHLTDAAEAQIRLQTARSMELDNDYKKVTTFFDKREENLRRRADLRSLRHEITRQRGVERQVAASQRKHTPQEKIRTIVSGTVDWPRVLRGESYRSDRKIVERTVEQVMHASNQVEYGDDEILKGSIARMKQILRSRIRELNPTEYMAAKRFLETLQGDFHQPQHEKYVVSVR